MEIFPCEELGYTFKATCSQKWSTYHTRVTKGETVQKSWLSFLDKLVHEQCNNCMPCISVSPRTTVFSFTFVVFLKKSWVTVEVVSWKTNKPSCLWLCIQMLYHILIHFVWNVFNSEIWQHSPVR
jgi:hypothetical protein